MDLLDSILDGMEKPPNVKRPEIKDKEKREKLEKIQRERQQATKKRKELLEKFRDDIIQQVRDFVGTPTTDDPNTYRWRLEPMSQVSRTIVHEACEDYEEDLIVHSFGTEEIDRHCIIWKKGYEPCEEEIRVMKLGLEYNPKKDQEEDNGCDGAGETTNSKTREGKDKFWSKYEKIIGENASGLESARVALPAKQYGCVPIDKKKDQRSIEQMMDDIRRKKLRTDDVSTSLMKKDHLSPSDDTEVTDPEMHHEIGVTETTSHAAQNSLQNNDL